MLSVKENMHAIIINLRLEIVRLNKELEKEQELRGIAEWNITRLKLGYKEWKND